MHAEHIYFTRSHLLKILEHKGNIFAVGTTSARTLETIYWLGCKVNETKNLSPGILNLRQWEDHSLPIVTKAQSLEALISFFESYNIEDFHTNTQLMIIPGYQYRMVNRMLTNFHQPKSSLLLLVSAFIGNDWREVYKYAMKNDFRFLSYGDSSLLIPR